jgi:hypothetical protein
VDTVGRKVCAVLLAVQIGVPLYQLGAPGSARFGWQMFSRAGGLPVFEVQKDDGVVDTLRVTDLLVLPRQEIDFAGVLPPVLCERAGVERVVVRSPGTRIPEPYRCR